MAWVVPMHNQSEVVRRVLAVRGMHVIQCHVCACMQVPYWQSKIVQGCRKRGKPVIVATNMLESMIDNPTPTRAEVRMQPRTLPCCASDLFHPFNTTLPLSVAVLPARACCRAASQATMRPQAIWLFKGMYETTAAVLSVAS